MRGWGKWKRSEEKQREERPYCFIESIPPADQHYNANVHENTVCLSETEFHLADLITGILYNSLVCWFTVYWCWNGGSSTGSRKSSFFSSKVKLPWLWRKVLSGQSKKLTLKGKVQGTKCGVDEMAPGCQLAEHLWSNDDKTVGEHRRVYLFLDLAKPEEPVFLDLQQQNRHILCWLCSSINLCDLFVWTGLVEVRLWNCNCL